MDYYHVDDPACAQCKVELNGVICKTAIEASAPEGWVRYEKEELIGWGQTRSTIVKSYGRIHIVKYLGYEDEAKEDFSKENVNTNSK